MDIYTFMGSHPFLTFFLAAIAASVLTAPFSYAFKAYNRNLRSKNIANHGWPPEHCDADGDFRDED